MPTLQVGGASRPWLSSFDQAASSYVSAACCMLVSCVGRYCANACPGPESGSTASSSGWPLCSLQVRSNDDVRQGRASMDGAVLPRQTSNFDFYLQHRRPSQSNLSESER